MIAEIQRRWECKKGFYIHMLFLKNFKLNTAQEFPIPDSYINFSSLDFNTQGTKLILHGLKYDSDRVKDVTDWFIMPIAPETKEESLGEYFEKKLICKKGIKDV